MTSDLVMPRHLCRKAVIYVRQSTPHQVLSNQESLRLQYALRQRARDLGWNDADIEVIDADLGQSGAAAEHRLGFKDLIARVTLGEVGLILSYEVTRLARNCLDWYPLLDLCGYRQCLIGDRDGVYDAGSANGRLLLGLKGTISEVELHTLRGRLTAGLLSKAERGDLALALPAGLVRGAQGAVTKDPDHAVQGCVALVFSSFLEQRSAAKVMRSLRARGLNLPRREPPDAEEPSIRRGLRLRPHPQHRVLRRAGGHDAPAVGRVADRGEGPLSCPSSGSRRCCATTTRSISVTGHAALPATAPPCSRVSPGAASAATSLLCSTGTAPVYIDWQICLHHPAAHPRRSHVPAPSGQPDRRLRGGCLL